MKQVIKSYTIAGLDRETRVETRRIVLASSLTFAMSVVKQYIYKISVISIKVIKDEKQAMA